MPEEMGKEIKFSKVKLVEINEAYQKAIYWFFSFPDKATSLNELSSSLQISKTTSNRVIAELEKEGFITKEIYGKTWAIKCNKEHHFNYTKKIAFNLAMIL